MPSLQICVIDHRDHDYQPVGRIIRPWLWVPGLDPGTEYADFCALYEIWKRPGPPPDIIGFFGYRKYLMPSDNRGIDGIRPAHAPNWYECDRELFDNYRDYLSGHDGSDIKTLLAQYDILQAAPFPLRVSICEDFATSRSKRDEKLLWDTACAHFAKVHTVHKIYPYLFITRWSVFDRMMREMEPLRLELHDKCVGADSANEEYKKRPMAYVMERIYSLWLENSGLSTKEMPLLHCWEKS